MCFDGLEEIGKVVAELRQHYLDRTNITAHQGDGSMMYPVEVTFHEYALILDRRVVTAETRLRELGFEPKKRVQEGDFAKQAKENGITLPGQIPGAD